MKKLKRFSTLSIMLGMLLFLCMNACEREDAANDTRERNEDVIPSKKVNHNTYQYKEDAYQVFDILFEQYDCVKMVYDGVNVITGAETWTIYYENVEEGEDCFSL